MMGSARLNIVSLWICGLMILGVSQANASDERDYMEANEAFNRSDFDASALRFREALRLMPSDSPYYHLSLLGLALSQERRFDRTVDRKASRPELACEAAERYRQYLATAGSQAAALTGLTNEALASKGKLDVICTQANRDAAARLGSGPAADPAGAQASSKGQSTASTLTGKTADPSKAGRASGTNILGWSTAAGATATLGVGIALYLNAADRFDESKTWIDRHNAEEDDAIAAADLKRARTANDEGKGRAYASYALLGSAAVLAGVAVWAFWFRDASDATANSRQIMLVPTADGLGFVGSF